MTKSAAQELRDDVQELKFNFKQVIEPSLKTIMSDLKEVKEKDYMTEGKVAELYVTKVAFNALRDRYEKSVKYTVTIIFLLIGGIITLGYQLLGRNFQ